MTAAKRRTIATELFGTLDVADDQLFDFTDGILGFPSCKQWVFIEGSKPGTAWLQSADQGALTLLLVDPFRFFDGFSADLAPADMRIIEATDASKVAVFAIVTLPASRSDDATANLQGPVVINLQSRRAMQVVLGDSRWSITQPLPMHMLG